MISKPTLLFSFLVVLVIFSCSRKTKVAEAYPEIMKQMQQEMLQRFLETHPDAEQCPEELTLEGKLVWFCEPRDVGTDQSLTDEPVRVFK